MRLLSPWCPDLGPHRNTRFGPVRSRTIAELLPCVVLPSQENSDAALERMTRECQRLSQHITDLMRTRDALDELMAMNRAHRESLLTAAAAS
ncbi:hypothetical protein [Nonomuraea sp. CA-141351]|uniref:hypothetical protein n=1 Tax=Nonomuraea sp. CA-141351 TaxID=3239996 RepID=UPI003D9191EE